jgi:hypothetical protein
MKATLKAVLALAVTAAVILSGNQVLARSGGGPSQAHGSGANATSMQHATGTAETFQQKVNCPYHHCAPQKPIPDKPPCRGGHMGPNGVMIQCR